jgi:hypothetical protein
VDQVPLQPGDFWKYPGLSPAVPVLGNLLSFVPLAAPDSSGFIPWVIYPSQLLAHLPLYGLNASKALVYSGVKLALPATGVGLMSSGCGSRRRIRTGGDSPLIPSARC